jgi:hypothetical protein
MIDLRRYQNDSVASVIAEIERAHAKAMQKAAGTG